MLKFILSNKGLFFLRSFLKMFRLGALFKLSGMEFQNKAPLYLNEFLPTSRLKRGTCRGIQKKAILDPDKVAIR